MRHNTLKYVLISLLCTGLLQVATTNGQSSSKSELMEKRKIMVQSQLKERGINNEKVLNAMLKVERHLFVPPEIQDYAYHDGPLAIGYNQTISQPYIVAYMTEALNLKNSDKILEIGTGSGYQAAILGELCDSVFSIEIVEPLGIQAAKLLKTLGYTNIQVKVGDGYQGWPQHAPFDAIIVTCAPTHVPEPLVNQLTEGGKLIIPYGGKIVQKLVLFTKVNGKLKHQSELGVRFVPMLNKDGKAY